MITMHREFIEFKYFPHIWSFDGEIRLPGWYGWRADLSDWIALNKSQIKRWCKKAAR